MAEDCVGVTSERSAQCVDLTNRRNVNEKKQTLVQLWCSTGLSLSLTLTLAPSSVVLIPYISASLPV